MKLLVNTSLIAILFVLTGCLGYQAVEYRIFFNENFKGGKVQITFEDIRSDNDVQFIESDKKNSLEIAETRRKRMGDFDDVIKMCTSDEELIDAMDQGIYLKERYLFESNNKLFGRWEGIFSELKFDEGDSLRVLKDEIYLTMEADNDTERIETDGNLTLTGNRFTITWPKTKCDIYWKIILKEQEKARSLINEYRAWRDKK